ncbi:acyl-CoA dehydrogenase family protein [Alloalcanivorax xenomutans]|uniref:acyl-CoA dehydrogenase family protein n=1 Tax=Alloalcanivorax xenomutans TaxID=1094342 RepID=UPI001F1AE7BB|nr:acyl-CoA dehydrogenase family protein [Alloalcanivorax xenomutans]MCE7522038.1 acyl-CoA dehydrogenase family protein [Alloalcanivorax xenomutans]
MHSFRFDPVNLPPEVDRLRQEVREFLADQLSSGLITPHRNSWGSFDPDFSRECGRRGYIGMRWPKQYGGHERTALERYVVTEEMLAAGAPVGAHWVADRQSGNNILAHGSEQARQAILPEITAGRCFFSIGMSEPNSGSDLAAASTRAKRVEGGWRITGSKVWTSGAHRNHYLIALVRTAPRGEDRHAGLTQFIVDMNTDGVTTRPIYNLYGGHDFNEVIFDEAFVPDHMMIGKEGDGWRMVTGELAFERSGPDRFLSTFQLLRQLIDKLQEYADKHERIALGRLLSHLTTLRIMSLSVAGMLERGDSPNLEAALVKDIGTAFEQEIPEIARLLVDAEPSLSHGQPFNESLARAILTAPSFTIRGGTREILRGIIAKGLGLR